ncbi:MAG: alpha/beta fold hydrolase [Candidatus Cyclobacteriaceae bacterium M3_2C_046]
MKTSINFKMKLRFFYLMLLALALSNAAQAQIEWAEFPGKIPEEHQDKVKFGYLTVPENHDQPTGRKIQVAFSLLQSNNNDKQDALIFLPGGPGGNATSATGILLNMKPIQKILEQKDIVLLDPRGCGHSSPSLCENLNDLEIYYPHFFDRTDEEIKILVTKAVKACKDTLNEAGIDPTAYSAVSVAHDVEMLRKTLGYEQFILRGHSYGSYYSQAVIHHYPESVKAAIISGLVPKGVKTDLDDFNNMVRSFQLTFDACQKDASCKQQYPDLKETFMATLEKLDQSPIILDVADKTIEIDASAFISIAFGLNYFKDGLEVLPLLIKSVEEDKQWVFQSLANALLATFSAIENDMLHIIKLNDKSLVYTPADGFKDEFTERLYHFYNSKLHYDLTKIYRDELGIKAQPFDTTRTIYDTPILLFDGLYDPVTPPANTDKVAAYFPNHFKFTVTDRSHDASASFENIMPEYISKPGQQPNLSELDELEGLSFATEVTFNKGVSTLAGKVVSGNYLNMAIIAGIFLLLLLIGFFYFPVRFLVRKLRKKPVTLPLSTNLSTWAVTLLAIGFLALLAMALMDTMETNQYLAIFGLSGQWSFIFIIPWLLLVALIASLYFSKSVWRTSTGNKIFWSVSWLGGLGMIVFLVVNGFIG